MKKRFTINIVMPVTLDVIGDDKSGEVIITNVQNISIPSTLDIHNSLTDEGLQEVDEAFAKAGV